MEAMCRQDALQPFNKSSKLSPSGQQRSVVFPQTPCSRNFSLLDKSGPMEAGFNQINVKNQRVLASPTSTSQLHSEFSDWHLWKCGQCFKTFTQRILLQMHVCTQNPDRWDRGLAFPEHLGGKAAGCRGARPRGGRCQSSIRRQLRLHCLRRLHRQVGGCRERHLRLARYPNSSVQL